MRSIRISIACISFILLMFGMVMVYSSSAIYAFEIHKDSLYFLKKHLLAMAVGAIFTFFIMSLDCEKIREHSKKIILFSIVLLALILIPGVGKSAGGARRWMELGFLRFQPAEFCKIAVLIYLSDFVSRKHNLVKDFLNGFLPPLIMLGGIVFLVLLQPDLGTAVLIGFIGLLILFISGSRLSHLLATMSIGIPFVYYLIFSVPYRKKRLMTFINPWMDEKGTGFQIIQSFLALGSGGLFGVGLGQSKQKLFFLPASHTDFIFSIIGEELGLMGTMAIIMLFFSLIWHGSRAAFKVNDIFKKNLIFGIVFTIGFEVIVNIGVVVGLLPTKGLPLPFLSYGGTSLVMHMIAIGLLLNATRE